MCAPVLEHAYVSAKAATYIYSAAFSRYGAGTPPPVPCTRIFNSVRISNQALVAIRAFAAIQTGLPCSTSSAYIACTILAMIATSEKV